MNFLIPGGLTLASVLADNENMGGVYQSGFPGPSPQFGNVGPTYGFNPVVGPSPGSPLGGPNQAQVLAGLGALLMVVGQMAGGWQGFVGAQPQQFAYPPGGPQPQPFPLYQQPSFGPVNQWGWRGINVNDLAPPMPGAYQVVGVNTAPYALLPAGQGSLTY